MKATTHNNCKLSVELQNKPSMMYVIVEVGNGSKKLKRY